MSIVQILQQLKRELSSRDIDPDGLVIELPENAAHRVASEVLRAGPDLIGDPMSLLPIDVLVEYDGIRIRAAKS